MTEVQKHWVRGGGGGGGAYWIWREDCRLHQGVSAPDHFKQDQNNLNAEDEVLFKNLIAY